MGQTLRPASQREQICLKGDIKISYILWNIWDFSTTAEVIHALRSWKLFLLYHHWSCHQLHRFPNHRAGFYNPCIYMAFLLSEQQRKLTLCGRSSWANNKQSAKKCKDNWLDSGTQSKRQGRSHTGNYKEPSPAESRLQQRGGKGKAFCLSQLLLPNVQNWREVNGEASQWEFHGNSTSGNKKFHVS